MISRIAKSHWHIMPLLLYDHIYNTAPLFLRQVTSVNTVLLQLISELIPILSAWLIHWGRVTHICVGKLINIGSDNGLSPGWRQAIIWTNAWILLVRPLGTNFSEFLIVIHTFSFNEMHLKMASAKWRPFCLGLNVLMDLESPVTSGLPSQRASNTENVYI